MSRGKTYLGYDVFVGARTRIAWIFEEFSQVYLSFSGGKDSTVMLHLCAEEARRLHRKFGVLFIDWECQYKLTIDHVAEMFRQYADVIEPYWCCIPLRTVNAVSVFEPEWVCWEEGKEWIREKPAGAITDGSFFPFYKPEMTFEEFVLEFGFWYAGRRKAACFVGIRAAESLNRWATVSGGRVKHTYKGKRWTTLFSSVLCNAYPLYDWSTEDIWTYCGKFGKCY
ncbi:MAG: phosphoadenosine phosphosulfate reductase family protein, partial [Lentisphaeria bacterium]|nr:phosphoadenosine phosphosulfate reductase family protein [Lentisphaeria bacterium]